MAVAKLLISDKNICMTQKSSDIFNQHRTANPVQIVAKQSQNEEYPSNIITYESPNYLNQSDDFYYDQNLGLALPSRAKCSPEDMNKVHEASVAKSVDPSGKITFVKIATQSAEGPLMPVENDVLVVLMTMFKEQRKAGIKVSYDRDEQTENRVYFRYIDICRALHLDAGSTSRIKRAIGRIKSQTLFVKYWGLDDGLHGQSTESKIIQRSGEIKLSIGKNVDKFSQVYYVDFDPYILKSFYYYAVFDQNEYLKLGAGAPRRLFVFLSAKRSTLGDNFIFELQEIVQVLGCENASRQKRAVLSVLENVRKALETFEYTISEKKRSKTLKAECSNYTVLISFKETNKQIAQRGNFYQMLLDWYGEEAIKGMDLLEIDVDTITKEIAARYAKESEGEVMYRFNKVDIHVGEFIVDIVLFQKLIAGYPVESFKGLCRNLSQKIINGYLEIPERYRDFVSVRIEQKKKEKDLEKLKALEAEKLKKDKEEEEIFNKRFTEYYNESVLTSDSILKRIRIIAINELAKDGYTEDNLAFESLLNHEMFVVARKLFSSGELSDMRGTNKIPSLGHDYNHHQINHQ